MSTPAIASVIIAGWTVFALLTRNGRHAAYVILVAAHRLLVPESGQRGLNEPAGVRVVLCDIALAAWWHAHDLAGRPRLKWRVWQIKRALRVRGCLAAPEDLPAEVRHPDEEAVPVPEPIPGRALTASTDATAAVNPYPALTAPQAELREQMEPVSAARPFVLAEEYMP